jgi:hypothetical protein
MLDDEVHIDPETAIRIAYEGCVFFYPLVLLDAARRQHPAGANQFYHDWGPARHCVAHPNPQVLYSTAWLDVAAGPVVLGAPNQRACPVQISMIDARGRVFASAGGRDSSVLAREIAIVGPGWAGEIGQGRRALHAPTNHVWVVARTLIDPEAEVIASAMQHQLSLTATCGGAVDAEDQAPRASVMAPWPARACATMSAESFFQRLAGLLDQRPASRRDAAVMEPLRRIGVIPGRRFALDRLPSRVAQAVSEGVARAQWAISTPGAGDGAGQWTLQARQRSRTDEPLAAAILAHTCIGLNFQEDAIYFVSETDSDGERLNGRHRYRLHFDQYRTPQVEESWSLTAYDLNGELPTPAGGRLGLSDRDRLRFNADGSVDLRIQSDPPLYPLAPNWTPCPPGDFRLVLRAYGPRHSVLSGLWRPPAVRRMHDNGLRSGAGFDLPQVDVAAMASMSSGLGA